MPNIANGPWIRSYFCVSWPCPSPENYVKESSNAVHGDGSPKIIQGYTGKLNESGYLDQYVMHKNKPPFITMS